MYTSMQVSSLLISLYKFVSGIVVNLASHYIIVMHRKFVSVSVIPLWCLLFCTVVDPDHGV